MKPRIFAINADTETPITLFAKLCDGKSPSFLLESAEKSGENGRFSFIGFDPEMTVSLFENSGKGIAIVGEHGVSKKIPFTDPLAVLRKILKKYSFPAQKNFPRFQGGLVGYFGYDLVRFFEKIPLPSQKNPLLQGIPEGMFFFPKTLLAFDHFQSKLFVLTFDPKSHFLNKLREKIQEQKSILDHPVDLKDNFEFPKNSYFQKKASKAKKYIQNGECIQVVLSQNFTTETDKDDLTLYRNLRAANPSPYMYLLRFPTHTIIGSSPETLVRVENSEITVRPIAGTRPRGKSLAQEKRLIKELCESQKELAEHRMLVDLGRNDVGRVSKKGTVRETKLLSIEKYSHVMHLVSEIRGTLDPKKTVFDVFRACFPAGTLTGAPKIRAMELISELEKERRGIYGGAVGYFDVSGNMDFAIAIRTIIKKGNAAIVQSGAGIVYDSLPEMENEECRHKARACLAVL